MTKEDYFKYYIQGSDHYLIPRDIFEELFNEMTNWKEESEQLKEVIEEVRVYVEDSANQMSEDATYYLLQILDKAKGEENE